MIYTLCENTPIAPGVRRMRLSGDTRAIRAPGQFVNIALDGLYLRRPISICDWDGEGMTLVYKVVGRGTEKMAALTPGAGLDLLCPLGNGFDVSAPFRAPLVIGGGVGAPPMLGLCRALVEKGLSPRVILGFNSAREAILLDGFRALGADVTVTTADGSMGARGFVTAAMDLPHDYFFACGPEPMLRAVAQKSPAPGQLSFEERMGCGFGVCMGCSCQTKYGAKRICKDGPVLLKEEIIW